MTEYSLVQLTFHCFSCLSIYRFVEKEYIIYFKLNSNYWQTQDLILVQVARLFHQNTRYRIKILLAI